MINDLLNDLKAKAGISQDKSLAEILKIHPCVISDMRSGSLVMGAAYIIKIHEAYAIPVAEIKRMAGVTRSLKAVEQVPA